MSGLVFGASHNFFTSFKGSIPARGQINLNLCINGDDARAHYECDYGHPYRTADSPLSTPARLGARSRSCAKPHVARDCPLAYSISQEKA